MLLDQACWSVAARRNVYAYEILNDRRFVWFGLLVRRHALADGHDAGLHKQAAGYDLRSLPCSTTVDY